MHPHHRPSQSDGIDAPWPGLLVGGGNNTSTQAPNGNKNGATNWTDDVNDYELNEVAINWNAPLTYALASFLDADTGSTTNSDAAIVPADASGGAGGNLASGGAGGSASGGTGGMVSAGSGGNAGSGGVASGGSGGSGRGGSGGTSGGSASGGSAGISNGGAPSLGGSNSGGSTGSGGGAGSGGQPASTNRTSNGSGCGCVLGGVPPESRSPLILAVLFVAAVVLWIRRIDQRIDTAPARKTMRL